MKFPANLMIWYASGLHFVWGICLLLDWSAKGIVGMYLLSIIFPGVVLIIACFAVALLAVWGTLTPKSALQIFFLAPQQFFLFLSAVSSVHCVWKGSYADGVIHPPIFILADQVSSVLIFLFYSWSVFLAYQRSVELMRVPNARHGTD